MVQRGGIRTKLRSNEGRTIIIVVAGIVTVDVVLLVVGMWTALPLAAALGAVGIITFFGMLMLTNYLSDSASLDKGEMRKALAAAFTAVYLALVSLLAFGAPAFGDTELSRSIVSHFTYLMGIIIVFYFTSSAVRDYLTLKRDRDSNT